MDSVSLALVPSRGRDIAEALSHALGRGERNYSERAAAPAAPALALLQGESRHPEQERHLQPNASRGRRRLWQLPPVYHCSLLGVCLGLDEMRRMASRLGLCTSARASDYEIHHQLVRLAGIAGRESRRLDRYLEEKFARVLRAFRAHRDEAALRRGWECALEAEDDLGGNYFALLTHPALDKSLAQEAMGHVHMLSHVAASALRRVRGELERARARVADHEAALEGERRARIRQTKRLLRYRQRMKERECASGPPASDVSSSAVSSSPSASAKGRAPADTAAEVREIRDRLEKSEHERRAWRRLYRRARRQIEALESEVSRAPSVFDLGESFVPIPEDRSAGPESESARLHCDLAGRVVAYVGGRGRVVPRLRALTERCNGRFVYHDGGLQERAGRIDESLAGSDIVVVPLDCVSHDASRRLKRRCRAQGKTILWLRSASVSAFESALQRAMQAQVEETKRECVVQGERVAAG